MLVVGQLFVADAHYIYLSIASLLHRHNRQPTTTTTTTPTTVRETLCPMSSRAQMRIDVGGEPEKERAHNGNAKIAYTLTSNERLGSSLVCGAGQRSGETVGKTVVAADIKQWSVGLPTKSAAAEEEEEEEEEAVAIAADRRLLQEQPKGQRKGLRRRRRRRQSCIIGRLLHRFRALSLSLSERSSCGRSPVSGLWSYLWPSLGLSLCLARLLSRPDSWKEARQWPFEKGPSSQHTSIGPLGRRVPICYLNSLLNGSSRH